MAARAAHVTVPLPAGDLVGLRAAGQGTQGATLLVHHQGGMAPVELAPGAGRVIGRTAPADVRIDDESLSRRHARFTLLDNGAVRVQDLGSLNGTWIQGERVTEGLARIGDEVMLGRVIVMIGAAWTWGRSSRNTHQAEPPLVASAAMRRIFDTVARLARSSIPVLLQGETGTGKEVVARALHEQGGRQSRPMICVNCGAIPQQLVESTLFGHERGAFTGASQQQKGIFEAADGGTVFLDEIGELPLAAQAALLRVIETKRVTRVGSTKEIDVDVRLIAATHRDLEAMSASGAFRMDLFYRLSTMTLTLPPLRERAEEIEPLALRFLQQANEANGRRMRGIEPEALALLRSYSWSGNVRELRNAIERAVVIAEGDFIGVQDLPERVGASAQLGAAAERKSVAHGEPLPAGDAGGLRSRMQRYEAQLIVWALREAQWNQTEAARKLDMPLRTLVHRMKVLGIKKLGFGPAEPPSGAPPEGEAESDDATDD